MLHPSSPLRVTIVIGLIGAAAAVAQIGGTGSIQGVITDASGAVVPAATVTATNNGMGVKTVRQTTDAGYYVLSPLPAGEYTVTVSDPLVPDAFSGRMANIP